MDFDIKKITTFDDFFVDPVLIIKYLIIFFIVILRFQIDIEIKSYH
jgi:hypothetical protein